MAFTVLVSSEVKCRVDFRTDFHTLIGHRKRREWQSEYFNDQWFMGGGSLVVNLHYTKGLLANG